MLGILEKLLGLASIFLGERRDREGRKYRDRMVELKLNVVNEQAKGQLADDVKIEGWIRELEIVIDAAMDEARSQAEKKE